MSAGTGVTVDALAAAKGLDPETVASFGVSDAGDHVRFAYRLPSGEEARTRLRTAMRGADGSEWEPGSHAPITAYSTPRSRERAAELGWTLLVEGESDCWTAWACDLPAVGIPGSAHVDALDLAHVDGASRIFLVEERQAGVTYPEGVAAFVTAVRRRLDAVGWAGELHTVLMPEPYNDVNDFYQSDPAGFAERLSSHLRALLANG